MNNECALRDELLKLKHRYHVNHPFDKLLQSGRASREMLQVWAANRYYYQDTIPRKDAAIISKCPDSSVRAHWCAHVATHDVDGALAEWLQLTRALGLSDDSVVRGDLLLPATRFACDAYHTFCRDAPWQEGVCASMTHLFAGDIHRLRISNWPERYPWLAPEAFDYFKNRTQTLPGEIEVSLRLVADHFATSGAAIARAVEIVRFKQDVLWCMQDALWHYFFSNECRMPSSPAAPQEQETTAILRILGSAAGGGVPQWNRTDERNARARHGCAPRRTQCSAAATVDGTNWVLINCSPDFGAQWNKLLERHPVARLAAIVLTDAQLDHVGGLLSLRESDAPLELHCTRSVADVLRTDTRFLDMLGSYTTVVVHEMVTGRAHCVAGLRMHPILVSWGMCRYAKSTSDVVALRFGDDVLFAPCVAAINKEMVEAARFCRRVFFDGTFATDDEMPRVSGHLPMRASRHVFRQHGLAPPTYVHINNTNPCDGVDIASDGMEVELRGQQHTGTGCMLQ